MSVWDNYFSTYANTRDVKELHDVQRRFRVKSYQRRREQSQVDRKQDQRIDALEHENDDLKQSLCALVAVLLRRGQLDEAEAVEIVQPLLEPFVEDDDASAGAVGPE